MTRPEIIASNGASILVDPEDVPHLSKFKWHIDSSGYAYRHDFSGGRDHPKRMHRELATATHGMDVDHKNRNRIDNRKGNLRLCSRAQNLWNTEMKSRNTSGFKGVDFKASKGLFRARIRANGKRYFLGYFQTADEAGNAYREASEKLHQEFARS